MKNLVVKTNRQIAELREGEHLIKTYLVSTAKNGLGCESGSLCTPTGRLQIAQKIGYEMPVGAVFRSRIPTGEIWSSDPSNPLYNSSEDLVLTRILWLKGLEEKNSNTIDRLIYLHGTNHEHLLGFPSSHGCVRFSNLDILELFDVLEVGAEVLIE